MECSTDSDPETMPDKIKQYREQAAKYVALGEASSDVARKSKLLEMAETWIRLADQAQEIRIHGKDHLDV